MKTCAKCGVEFEPTKRQRVRRRCMDCLREAGRLQVAAWTAAHPDRSPEAKLAREALAAAKTLAIRGICSRCQGPYDKQPKTHWRVCRPCAAILKLEWKQTHAARNQENIKRYQEKNKARIPELRRRWIATHPGYSREQRWKSYGLRFTWPEYLAMYERQNGRCAICDQEDSRRYSLNLDHDDDLKQPRALLCGNCNRAIGLVKHDPAVLYAAAAYLETHRPTLKLV